MATISPDGGHAMSSRETSSHVNNTPIGFGGRIFKLRVVASQADIKNNPTTMQLFVITNTSKLINKFGLKE